MHVWFVCFLFRLCGTWSSMFTASSKTIQNMKLMWKNKYLTFLYNFLEVEKKTDNYIGEGTDGDGIRISGFLFYNFTTADFLETVPSACEHYPWGHR